MNLAEIRANIESALSHAPDTAAWRTRVRRTVNAALRDLARDHEFTAGLRDVDFWIRPDLTVTDWYQEEGSGLGVSVDVQSAVGGLTYCEVEAGGGRYELIGVRSGSALLWPLAAADVDGGEATLRWRRYRLPADVLSVTSLVVVDSSGAERPLQRTGLDRFAGIDPDEDIGDPIWWSEAPAIDWRRRLYGGLNDDFMRGVGAVEYGQTRAPCRISVALTNASNQWAAGDVITYRAAFGVRGAWVVGAPGPEVSVTISPNRHPTITYPTPPYNMAVSIFRRVNDGPWMLLTTVAGTESEEQTAPFTFTPATYADTGATRVTYGGGEFLAGSDAAAVGLSGPTTLGFWTENVHRYIEIRPRPTEALRARLTYRPASTDLWEDHDEPALPSQFHDYLVHEGVVRLAASMEGAGEILRVHRGLAARVLTQIKASAGGGGFSDTRVGSPLDGVSQPPRRWYGTPTWSDS